MWGVIVGCQITLPPNNRKWEWLPIKVTSGVSLQLAVLLVVSAEVRMRRMGVRGGVKTEEEEWLERSQKFQER